MSTNSNASIVRCFNALVGEVRTGFEEVLVASRLDESLSPEEQHAVSILASHGQLYLAGLEERGPDLMRDACYADGAAHGLMVIVRTGEDIREQHTIDVVARLVDKAADLSSLVLQHPSVLERKRAKVSNPAPLRAVA